MRIGPRSDLRRMGHRQHLGSVGQARQAHADRFGNRTAHRRVDFVKNQCWRRTLVGQSDLEGEQKARQLAT